MLEIMYDLETVNVAQGLVKMTENARSMVRMLIVLQSTVQWISLFEKPS